jgi:hypothetical protein
MMLCRGGMAACLECSLQPHVVACIQVQAVVELLNSANVLAHAAHSARTARTAWSAHPLLQTPCCCQAGSPAQLGLKDLQRLIDVICAANRQAGAQARAQAGRSSAPIKAPPAGVRTQGLKGLGFKG